jgi:hypothetical protein
VTPEAIINPTGYPFITLIAGLNGIGRELILALLSLANPEQGERDPKAILSASLAKWRQLQVPAGNVLTRSPSPKLS